MINGTVNGSQYKMQQIRNWSKSENTGINNFRNGNIRQIHSYSPKRNSILTSIKCKISKKFSANTNLNISTTILEVTYEKNSYYDKITCRRSFIN